MPTDREIKMAVAAFYSIRGCRALLAIRGQGAPFIADARAALIAAESVRGIDAVTRERVCRLLLRITDEQVPLFGSERLRTLHKDCGDLLHDLIHKRTE